jgi:hypothetical protein
VNNSKPILFNGEMVKAILSGRKTQTRRIMKPQPTYSWTGAKWGNPVFHVKKGEGTSLPYAAERCPCPYGKVGGSLWVRETVYAFGDYYYTGKLTESGKREVEFVDFTLKAKLKYIYAAETTLPKPSSKFELSWHKRPSIFMPRWASRINLEITKIRVEKLQGISQIDICSEGLNSTLPPKALYANFEKLWNGINEKRGFSWDSNPWVWVIEFKKAEVKA